VFVRRVASVKELRQKLEVEYDEWLKDRLRRQVSTRASAQARIALRTLFGGASDKTKTGGSKRAAHVDVDLIDDTEPVHVDLQDRGGNDTFFAWFFRGEGPAGVLSGAELASRLNTPRYALSSFFLDNWVASLLDVDPGLVLPALRDAVGMAEAELRSNLERIAGSVVPVRTKNSHRELFLAFQFAALSYSKRTRIRSGSNQLSSSISSSTLSSSASLRD
jgi:hypothetical protein